MPSFTIHPVLPTRPFGPAELQREMLIARLDLADSPRLTVLASSYGPILSPLPESLGAEVEEWEMALAAYGLALLPAP